ncbi:MAG: TetR/AcrR family transcriptional regulator, partial [Acidimicrobiia bacterium]|nr:TetR/AcrR family transcriptional regulator [Acidimicrobiia bacterium]
MNAAARIGRPPGPHDDTLAKLLPVALHLFIEEGGASLTPTRLHRETGIARATIYRNWPDPADLIEILLATAIEQPPGDEFQGDLRRDLHTAMDLLRQQFEERPVRALLAACLDYGRRSDRVA